MNNLTLIFNHFEEEHLGKDVFLVPYYLGKKNSANVTIVFPKSPTNESLPSEFNGVKLVALKSNPSRFWILKEFIFFKYLIQHAKQIDFFMRFHYGTISVLFIILYKWLNKRGKSYLKCDGVINIPRRLSSSSSKSFKTVLQNLLYSYFINKIDIVSCETSTLYDEMSTSSSSFLKLKGKLVLMPNGFDEEYLQNIGLQNISFEKKENIMITVGRLGTYQKNTEMFLDALSKVKLENWKILLIGSVEDEFKIYISSFYQKNPEKRDSVIFIGSIYDKEELWSYYNKAKVFILTSRWESYALVLNEAKRFRNYIISTSVGAFPDLVENDKYGSSIPQNDSNALANILSEIICQKRDINVYRSCEMLELSWEKMIEKLNV